MSYILDALRKADQERSIGDVPDLDTPHWNRRRGGHVRNWVWVAIGLLIVNGVFLAFLFNRDDGADSKPVVSADVPEQVESKPGLRSDIPAPPPAPQHEMLAKPAQPKQLPLTPMARPERTVIAKPRQPVPAVVERPPARSSDAPMRVKIRSIGPIRRLSAGT